MKLKIEINLSKRLQTGEDAAEVIHSEFRSFADRHDPLKPGERGPFFDSLTGKTIGSWSVEK